MTSNRFLRSTACGLIIALLATRGWAQTDVLTQHNDNDRTGWYDREAKLNPTSVGIHTFGRILTRTIDGRCMSQVLAVSNVPIPNVGTRNCIYVTTSKNSVYCWDAVSASTTTPYWQRNFGQNVLSADVNGGVKPDIGIVGTPVIDKAANALFVVAYTEISGVVTYHLYVVDIRTGADLPGSGLLIQGSVPGVGETSVGGVVTFDPRQHLQRTALLLQSGKIIICFCSHDDHDPYHGWVFEVDEPTMAIDAIFCDTPDSSRGGIWMSGEGPTSDGTAIYLTSGNGPQTPLATGNGYGDSVIKLQLDGHLTYSDYFSPYNFPYLDRFDLDFGSTGLLHIPGTNYLVAGSKTSTMYVLDKTNLGQYNSTTDNVVQSWVAGVNNIHGSPVWWNTASGAYTYVWSESDVLRQFAWLGDHFNTTAVATGSYQIPKGYMPGAMLSGSSYKGDPNTGILWALHIDHNLSPKQNSTGPAVLRAYRAGNVAQELWNSEIFPNSDSIGSFSKFCCPTIAFGRVYVPTSDGHIRVFGLLGTPRALLTLSNLNQVWDGTPKSVTVTSDPPGLPGANVTYNGSATPPTDQGTYIVNATLSTPGWVGPLVKGTLTITAPASGPAH